MAHHHPRLRLRRVLRHRQLVARVVLAVHVRETSRASFKIVAPSAMRAVPVRRVGRIEARRSGPRPGTPRRPQREYSPPVRRGPRDRIRQERLDRVVGGTVEVTRRAALGQHVAPGREVVQRKPRVGERLRGVLEDVVVEDDDRVLDGGAGLAQSIGEADLAARIRREVLDQQHALARFQVALDARAPGRSPWASS